MKKLLYSIVLMTFCFSASAQTNVGVMLVPIAQYFNTNGQVLSSGCLFTFAAGTNTNQATYSDSLGTVQLPNPILLNGSGYPTNASGGVTTVFVTSQSYKFVLKTSGGVNCATGSQIYSADNVQGFLGVLNLANTWAQQQTFSQPIVVTPTSLQAVFGAPGQQTTLNFPPPLGNIQLNFPNTADTMVGRATTDTLTGIKTFSSGSLIAFNVISATANPATSGFLRLANLDSMKIRNNANTADLLEFSTDASDNLTIGDPTSNGNGITVSSATDRTGLGGRPISLLAGGTATTNFSGGAVNINGGNESGGGVGFGGSINLTGGNQSGAAGSGFGGSINLKPGSATGGVGAGRVNISASSLVLLLNNIAFSTTPALDFDKGNVQQFSCTTPSSTVIPTLTTAHMSAGMTMTVIFVQNNTTACTWSWPATFHGAGAVSATLSSINVQEFIVSNNGTDLYAKGAISTSTGGTP